MGDTLKQVINIFPEDTPWTRMNETDKPHFYCVALKLGNSAS